MVVELSLADENVSDSRDPKTWCLTAKTKTASIELMVTAHYKLYTVVTGALAGFANLFAYGDEKCKYLAE